MYCSIHTTVHTDTCQYILQYFYVDWFVSLQLPLSTVKHDQLNQAQINLVLDRLEAIPSVVGEVQLFKEGTAGHWLNANDGDTLGVFKLPRKDRIVVAQHRSDRNEDVVPAQTSSARLDCASIEPAGPPSSDTCW